VIWSILYRTILWELVRVFALSLTGITGMLLMAGIVAEASQHGLSPGQILAAIPLLIPSTLPYTIPATTLFATCVVYGRLAHDNEILAIKAAGINILLVVFPAIFLGLAMTTLTIVFYYDLIPSTHHMMRAMVLKDVEEFLYSVLKREHVIMHPKLSYRMYVKDVQGRTLIKPIFEQINPVTKVPDVTAVAESAELHVDLPNKKIILHMKRCEVSSRDNSSNGFLDDQSYDVELPPDFDKSATRGRPGDMTWEELLDYRIEVLRLKENVDTQLAMLTSLQEIQPDPERLKIIEDRRYHSRQKLCEIRSVETEMLMRPALSVGCLCFVVVGCPVGIWFSKSDYLSAFITCFLPIVFLYYPLLLCGTNLAKQPEGKFNPIVAVWGADFIMAAVAVPLYRKLLKN
jgi:lipopolysaccharide export system permease protein